MRGALWIAGGIAARNPLILKSDYFIDELYNSSYRSAKWDGYPRSAPVFLMEDTSSGLWGAARFGQRELEKEETTEEKSSDAKKPAPAVTTDKPANGKGAGAKKETAAKEKPEIAPEAT